MGDKARPTGGRTSNNGRHKETRPMGRRTPSNKRKTLGDNGDEKTRGEKIPGGRHTIQQRETRRETRGDKTLGIRAYHPTKGSKRTRLSGRRAHHPKKGNKKGHNGRQQDSRESGHTIQQRETRIGKMGNKKADKTLGNPDTPSNIAKTRRGTIGDTVETRPWGRRAHHPRKRRPL